MKQTDEEKRLLEKLRKGELDGIVGDEKVYRGYSNIYCGKYIKNGTPVSYRTGESSKFFNGKENERIPGKSTKEVYETDEEKLLFLQKYGWLMDDIEVIAYSKKFKP